MALHPGKLWEVVMEEGRTFMATWMTEEERAAEIRRNKREAEVEDKPPFHRV